jgi:hypothetical protein
MCEPGPRVRGEVPELLGRRQIAEMCDDSRDGQTGEDTWRAGRPRGGANVENVIGLDDQHGCRCFCAMTETRAPYSTATGVTLEQA